MIEGTMSQAPKRRFPSSQRRSGRDINMNIAKPPFKGADGVVRAAKTCSGAELTTPSARNKVVPRLLIDRASTLPLRGGECSLHKLSGNERGVALVIMLLILSLTTALGLAMYVSTNSDLLITGFYRNFQGSFYAGDSGLNIARAQLLNQLVAAVPATFAVPPIANPATVATNAAN